MEFKINTIIGFGALSIICDIVGSPHVMKITLSNNRYNNGSIEKTIYQQFNKHNAKRFLQCHNFIDIKWKDISHIFLGVNTKAPFFTKVNPNTNLSIFIIDKIDKTFGALAPDEITPTILQDIYDAYFEANSYGIMPYDVSYNNIGIRDGRAYLIDYGSYKFGKDSLVSIKRNALEKIQSYLLGAKSLAVYNPAIKLWLTNAKK